MLKLIDVCIWFAAMALATANLLLELSNNGFGLRSGLAGMPWPSLVGAMMLAVVLIVLAVRIASRNTTVRCLCTITAIAISLFPAVSFYIRGSSFESQFMTLSYLAVPCILMLLMDLFAGSQHWFAEPADQATPSSEVNTGEEGQRFADPLKAGGAGAGSMEEIEVIEQGLSSPDKNSLRWRKSLLPAH